MKQNSTNLSYRTEIDGLRAIAVISVILYHAQLVFFGRDWFVGGYIGVDIFFVISGYLITRIILSELNDKGSFSFLNFYERRARRIFPMLFFVIFISMPFAWRMLLPSAFVEYTESIISSIFFVSNFFFYFSTTEYGADSALLMPFLHTWSLAVEEQFYIVFPILALLSYKLFRSHFLSIIIGMSLLSILFSEVIEVRNSALNFYLPFSGFWELAIGSLLAVRELSHRNVQDNFLSKILPMVGLYLVVYAILFFDGETPHPSFYTLIPIVGVALIIRFASSDDLVGKALGSKPFVWVGLISYSAYLWHFPIFAFARNGALEFTNYDKLEWVVLTFTLSVASYFFVERTFRNRSLMSTKVFWSLIALSFSAILFLCIYGISYKNKEISDINRFLDNGVYDKEHTSFEVDYDYRVRNNGKPNILVVGNSHAEDLLKALSFSYLSEIYNLNLLSPLKRKADVNYQTSCFYEFLISGSTFCGDLDYSSNISKQYKNADVIILASRWKAWGKEEILEKELKMLPEILVRLSKDNKTVIVVSNTPESKVFGEKKLNRFDKFLFENKRLPRTEQLIKLEEDFYKDYSNQKFAIDRYRAVVSDLGLSSVHFANRSDFMCQALAQRCYLYFETVRVKVLFDYGHTTTGGARQFGKLIDKVRWLSDIL